MTFEVALSECLDALTEGTRDVAGCLQRYPQYADQLWPLLQVATAAADAYAVRPSDEYAARARERFLIATGQRLQEAMQVEPEPTFFAAARMRFLMAAQRAGLRERAVELPRSRSMPLFGSPFRALASGLAAVALFLSFSAYTVASASSSLPGDWQYPVKLQTERVRLALTFGDEAERDVKLDMAETRIDEIQQLANKGKIIGPGVIDRLVEQTEPLVQDAADGGWNPDEAARLQTLGETQQQVLEQVQDQVAPDAQERLSQADAVASAGVDVSKKIIFFEDPSRGPVVVTPEVVLTPTPSDTATPAPSATAQAGASSTAVAGATTPEASPTDAVPTASANVEIGSTPAASRNSIKLYPLTAGQLRVLVPGTENGWRVDDIPTGGVPPLVRLRNADGSSIIALNPMNGDMYWYIRHNGSYDEVRMRIKQDESTFVARPADLHLAYGDAATIPLYILESIEVLPLATPTPEPTSASVAPTATSSLPAGAPEVPQILR